MDSATVNLEIISLPIITLVLPEYVDQTNDTATKKNITDARRRPVLQLRLPVANIARENFSGSRVRLLVQPQGPVDTIVRRCLQ